MARSKNPFDGLTTYFAATASSTEHADRARQYPAFLALVAAVVGATLLFLWLARNDS
jgi:hypothetical protein